MSLPASWVDHIFAKLTLTYGQRFTGLYAGLEINSVKRDWGATLSALQHHPQAISFALENLPVDLPPTSLQFREIARACPAQPQRRLPIPDCDPSVKAEAIETLRHFAANFGRNRNHYHRRWAEKLCDRERRGEKLTTFQREAWREALRQPVAVEDRQQ